MFRKASQKNRHPVIPSANWALSGYRTVVCERLTTDCVRISSDTSAASSDRGAAQAVEPFLAPKPEIQHVARIVLPKAADAVILPQVTADHLGQRYTDTSKLTVYVPKILLILFRQVGVVSKRL